MCTWHGGAPGAGAPKGNQNGRKTGAYSRRAEEAMRERIEELLKVEGLTNEIAYMRGWIERAIGEERSMEEIGKAMDVLARLTRTQELIRRQTKTDRVDITKDVIERFGGQTGLWELMGERND